MTAKAYTEWDANPKILLGELAVVFPPGSVTHR